MNASRKLMALLALVMILSMLVGCAQPTPQVVKETVVVEKAVEKQVVQTKVVEATKLVEKVVEKQVTVAAPARFKEAPMLAEQVKAGKLPPVDKRLPESPVIIDPVEAVGQYGGTWRMIDSGDSYGPDPHDDLHGVAGEVEARRFRRPPERPAELEVERQVRRIDHAVPQRR